MKFVYGAWYVVAYPSDINRTMRRRTILNLPILLYRDEDGKPVALKDSCPHRFAPLHLGTLVGDSVECKYHGLRFNSGGKCILNPHGPINKYQSVRSFPIIEKYDLCWIWMGDPDQADPALIPDMSYVTQSDISRSVHNYIHADYRYDILIDNLMDLSHGEYLHAGSISGGVAERVEYSLIEKGNEVIFLRKEFNAPPAPIPLLTNHGLVDIALTIHWHPSQVIRFEQSITPSENPAAEAKVIRFAHVATPETESSTHYFMSTTYYDDINNDELALYMKQAQYDAISGEDGPMLLAVDRDMAGAELLELRPVVLPSDAGALRVRRVVSRLLKEEEQNHAKSLVLADE